MTRNKNLEYHLLNESKNHVNELFPINIYLCSIPRDFKQVSPHWHEEMELIIIKKGKGVIAVDTQPREVVAGDIIIIRPGQIHSIHQEEQNKMEYENIFFTPSLLYSQLETVKISNYFQSYFKLKTNFRWLIDKDCSYHKDLLNIVSTIDDISHHQPMYYELALKAKLLEFFFILFSKQEKELPLQSIKSILTLKEIILYIEKEYQNDITPSDVAQYINFSTSHFMKFFKQHTHMTFTQYLNQYRLNKASQLLQTTNLPVLDISIQVGFNNLSYFNRLFKAHFNTSPLKIRNKKEIR